VADEATVVAATMFSVMYGNLAGTPMCWEVHIHRKGMKVDDSVKTNRSPNGPYHADIPLAL
jgi:hypothetical protein